MEWARRPGLKRHALLWAVVMWAALLGPAGGAFAQDGANLDQVKSMYQDALKQLKAAQDRKSELANENAKLAAHAADLEKQIEAYKRDAAGEAERTFFLRSRYAAWQEFMKQYPDLMERWKDWLEGGGVKTGMLPAMGDEMDWPFSEEDVLPTKSEVRNPKSEANGEQKPEARNPKSEANPKSQ